jgi:hypothetical protein
MECAIYRIVGGEYSGEYVMGCATESYGYLSMLFIFTLHRVVILNAPSYPKSLLKICTKTGVLVKEYPVRGKYVLNRYYKVHTCLI